MCELERIAMHVWGTCHRSGLGRLKHMEVESLWVQEAVAKKRVELVRVDWEYNPADCLTK